MYIYIYIFQCPSVNGPRCFHPRRPDGVQQSLQSYCFHFMTSDRKQKHGFPNSKWQFRTCHTSRFAFGSTEASSPAIEAFCGKPSDACVGCKGTASCSAPEMHIGRDVGVVVTHACIHTCCSHLSCWRMF